MSTGGQSPIIRGPGRRDRDVLADEPLRRRAHYANFVAQAKEQLGGKLTPEIDEKCKAGAVLFSKLDLQAILRGKLDASYWLGLIELDQGQYLSALDYFNVRVVKLDHNLAWAAGTITMSPAAWKPAGGARRRSGSMSPAATRAA